MQKGEPRIVVDKASVLKELVNILTDMTTDWDIGFSGEIGPQTCLVSDLEFSSIDVVHLVIAIDERFQKVDFPFEQLLMVEGRYVDDLRVEDVVDFLFERLNG